MRHSAVSRYHWFSGRMSAEFNVRELGSIMASKGQLTGMTGTFLVAAQLSNLGFTVSTTSRSAAGADILVTNDECSVAYSVQVKANGKKANAWLLGNKQPPQGGKIYIYVFVNLISDKSGVLSAEYFVVPSAIVYKIAILANESNLESKWRPYVVMRDKIEKYFNKWGAFKA